jgi:Ca-activated chloride channel family protein
MFRFAHPEYLNALYIVPVLLAVYLILVHNRNKSVQKFADKELLKFLIPDYSSFKNSLKFILFLATVVLLIISLANPQVGTRLTEVKQTGIDVYIVLDVSLSMQAEDIKPNRLEKAKYQISSLIQKLRGDRIGLVVFSGDAYIQFPLTTDYSAANLFLSAVDVFSVPQPGTAVASAIDLARKSFDTLSTQKVIVVITDGEDHEGDISSSVSEASAMGIKIYTIGLGSPEGAPIPVYNNRGEMMGFKTDRDDNTVISKLDEQVLINIAEESDGKYFRGNNYEDHLQKIYDDLSIIEKSEFGTKKVTDFEDRFYYFLIPALLLLIIDFFISEIKSVWYSRLNKKLGIE